MSHKLSDIEWYNKLWIYPIVYGRIFAGKIKDLFIRKRRGKK